MAERAGLGSGRRQAVVPAQSGRAISVSRGDPVRVVDIESHQVGDMWAVDAADHSPWLSVSHTPDRCERLFPAVIGQFCDQRGTPVLIGRPHLAWRPRHALPAVRPVTVREQGAGRPPEPPGQSPGPRGLGGIVLPVVPDPVNLFQNGHAAAKASSPTTGSERPRPISHQRAPIERLRPSS
jgi:hypothetical protein